MTTIFGIKDWGSAAVRKMTEILIVMALSMMSAMTYAVPGIVTTHNSPRYTGENRMIEEDMRVKIKGGYFRVNRTWTEKGWVWNRRLANLDFFEIVNPAQTCSLGISSEREYSATTEGSSTGGICVPQDELKAVVGMKRGDEPYVWDVNPNYWHRCIRRNQFSASTGSGGGVSGSINPDALVAIDCERKRFTSSGDKDIKTPDGSSYEWKDRQGNRIRYNGEGEALYYEDLNGVRVTLHRDSGGRLSSVTDDNGLVIVNFYYEHPTFRDAVTRVADYTGREVVYTYRTEALGEGHFPLIETIKDVRGEVWTYEYTNRVLSSRIDPESNRTDFSISLKGIMNGYKNADGVGITYNQTFDSGKEEYIQRITQSDGPVIESWFNKLGHLTRQDINGVTQFTAQYIMSDGTDGVSEPNARRTAPVKFGSYKYKASSSTSSSGKSYKINANRSFPSFEDKEPVWLRTKILTDRWGKITKTTYDRFGNMTKVEYPGGSYETWKYLNDLDFVTEHRDVKGTIHRFDYYSNGNLQTQTVALGTAAEAVTSYTYWPDGEVRTVTYHGDGNANTQTEEAVYQYAYDEFGNLTKVTDPYLKDILYQDYDALGNAWTVIDERQKTWRFEYDAVGNLTRETTPLLRVQEHHYDKAGRYDLHTAATLYTTTIQSNASGLPLTLTDKLGHSLTLTYDKGNRVKTVKDANNNTNTLKYDAFGRLFQTIDGEDNLSEYTYKNGVLEKATHPTYVEEYGYDNRMRLDTVTKKAGGINLQRKWTYNNAHEPTHYLDGEQKQTVTYYDALGRVERVLDAKQGETLYGYDDRGNLLYVEDPEHRRTQFAYNALDQLVSEELPLGQTRSYAYWEDGLLKHIVHGDGRVSYFAYDDDGRLQNTYLYDTVAQYESDAARTQASKNIHFTYHALGELETYNDGTTSATYTYNEIGLLQNVDVNYGPFSKNHSYTYHPNRQVHTYTNPEGITYTYQYNGNGQITSIDIPGEGQVSYNNYLWIFPDRRTLPGGGRIEQDPDGFMRFHAIKRFDPANNSAFDALYGYDLESNITSITSSKGNESYGYDDLYQLNSASQPGSSESFLYDGVGNRTAHNSSEENWIYNSNNQLESRPGVAYEYNANGHLSKRTEGGVVTDFIYNHEERLAEVRQNGTTLARYYYDPFGRRLWKEVGGTRTYFYYNHSGLVAEYNASGNLLQEYHYTPGKPWGTDPVFTRVAGNVYYYLTDHRFAPRQLVDKTGRVVWAANYSAFGQANIAVNTVNSSLRLAGQYFDAETGLHYNYMRDYDPATGRYVQSDPLGFTGGLNHYAYAMLNPLNRLDADGQLAPLIIPLIQQGVRMAGQAYLRCLGQCLAAAGVSVAVDAAVEALMGNCDGVGLGDEFAEVAGNCATACLNPLNWRAGKKWDIKKKRREGDFTRSQKNKFKEKNATENGGENKCVDCNKVVKPKPSTKEGTPDDQLQIHHDPPIKDGGGKDSEGIVLCPKCHINRHRNEK